VGNGGVGEIGLLQGRADFGAQAGDAPARAPSYPRERLRVENPAAMPKHLRLSDHLSTEDLERRYRRARAPVERSHYQIVWLIARGRLTRDIAAVTGYSPNWVGQLARRYNQRGPVALGDRRQVTVYHCAPVTAGL
jgi:hypothetical protein